jgi:acetyl-CoA synthetase
MGEDAYSSAEKAWKWDIPKKYNLGVDVIDKHAASANRNKVALYWENAAGATERYTFGDLKVLTDKFGNALRGLGLEKGDRFLIRLPNIPPFQISFCGGVKVGSVPIPSSVMFREHEVEYRLNDSQAKAVITTAQYTKEVHAVADKCPSLQHIIVTDDPKGDEVSFQDLVKGASRHLEVEPTTSTDMAFFCYTSGTTGNPKGAVHLHRWAIGNDPSVRFWQDGKDTDLIAHTGDLNWIYPLGNGFLYVWRWGISTMVYAGKFDPEAWFALLEKYKVTNLASVPTAYRMFLTVKDAERRYDLSSLRHCISAGEPLNPEVLKQWRERFKLDIYDGIGMTEVMVYVSNQPLFPIKPGSCGKPHPGHKCALVSEEGIPVPIGENGVLAISKDDPGLFREYWNKQEKTKECFRGNWFLSGDVLYQDEQGYYWFSGRNDDLIKASGYRISPFEVESAIISHPLVLECAVVASPDPMRGTIIKSFIVLKDPSMASPALVTEIQEHAKKVAAPYKYPREIEFVRELPKTQSGKIKRKELREREQQKKGGAA